MKVPWETGSIMSRIWTTTALASAAPLVAVPTEAGAQQSQLPSVTIGVITDGPSPRFQGFVATVMSEIQLLLERDAVASFPLDKQIAVEEGVGAAAAAIDQLLGDDAVDIVVTLGPVASHVAATRTDLPKPVIASFIYNPEFQGLPLTDARNSGVRNLNYIASGSGPRNLVLMREIAPFSRIALMLPAELATAAPETESRIEERAELEGLQVDIIPVRTSAPEALAQIDPAVDAVYVLPLLRFDDAEFQLLVDGLIDRGLPSFSWIGAREVNRGILAGWLSETFTQRLARRTAINVQRTALGEDPADLPVFVTAEESRSLNVGTARAINLFPPWEVYVESELLGIDTTRALRQLTLHDAVREAVDVNLDLAAEGRFVAAGAQSIRLATSRLLPQAGLGFNWRVIDEDLATATPAFLPQRSLNGFIGLSQVVYDERLWADRSIEKSVQSARELDFETLELNIVLDAATAYLNVLRAKTFETVQRENLALTRSNFELAQIRFSVGAAAASEVYRWESQIANDRQALIDAATFTRQVEIELRRILNRPLDEDFETQETDLSDPSLMASQDVLQPYVANPLVFERFQRFMAMEAIETSPELASLGALEQANERALTSATRSFFIPSVTLDAGVASFLSRGGELGTSLPGSSELNDTRWDIGLVLSYPLFTGLARSADQSRARERLSEIQFQVEAATDRIEQRLLANLYGLAAAATNITLSRQAADAAVNNYDVVRDAYARGVGNIIVLLDAQRSSVVAEEQAATAQFDFLIELMNVERSVGRFYFFASQDEFENFVQRLEAFFQTGN